VEWSDIVIANIEGIIKKKGYLQKTVAARAGVPEKTFSNMLNGRKLILAEDIPPIAQALGCKISELYTYPRNIA